MISEFAEFLEDLFKGIIYFFAAWLFVLTSSPMGWVMFAIHVYAGFHLIQDLGWLAHHISVKVN